jgi:CheY-like chemotaxis protein
MKTRILVVDDEPDFTHLLKVTLEAEGYYEVREENDAAAALSAAREFGPDLVVLDIMMPEMDGDEVAARLRNDPFLRDVPVIFMTALVSRQEAPEGTCQSGGQTFLPKDTPVDKLVECIEQKLQKSALAMAG